MKGVSLLSGYDTKSELKSSLGWDKVGCGTSFAVRAREGSEAEARGRSLLSPISQIAIKNALCGFDFGGGRFLRDA